MEKHEELVLKCVQYFRSRRGFDRVFLELRAKLRSYGTVSGRITLKEADEEERETLEAFFGTPMRGMTLSFPMKKFAAALAETRFREVELTELAEAYFGETILSNQERRRQIRERKKRFRETVERSVQEQLGGNPIAGWLGRLSDAQFQLWMSRCAGEAFPEEGEEAEKEEQFRERAIGSVLAVGRALRVIGGLAEGDSVRLAVLAMECAGDPHAFDREQVQGRLLLAVLSDLPSRRTGASGTEAGERMSETEAGERMPETEAGERMAETEAGEIMAETEAGERMPETEASEPGAETGGTAEQILELYIYHGIRPDDISSFTTLYGIRLFSGEESHPAFDAMIARREYYLVSLSNLRGITRAVPVQKEVYVVENQMVFAELCESCPNAALMCTSGQPKTASLLLLDLLCKENCQVYYSGDLDPEGVQIAYRLVRRSGGTIGLWHMTVSDYRDSLSAVVLSEERIRKLDRIGGGELAPVAEVMRKIGKAGYQEKLLDKMRREIKND